MYTMSRIPPQLYILDSLSTSTSFPYYKILFKFISNTFYIPLIWEMFVDATLFSDIPAK